MISENNWNWSYNSIASENTAAKKNLLFTISLYCYYYFNNNSLNFNEMLPGKFSAH